MRKLSNTPVAHDGLEAWINWEIGADDFGQLLGDIGEHAVVGFPFLFSGIHIETSACPKVPTILLTFNVATP